MRGDEGGWGGWGGGEGGVEGGVGGGVGRRRDGGFLAVAASSWLASRWFPNKMTRKNP